MVIGVLLDVVVLVITVLFADVVVLDSSIYRDHVGSINVGCIVIIIVLHSGVIVVTGC